mmetsp:Transcript_28218/g.25018  ORF Transcript_28218/g.25018 Transcript_28218/m.25018 type:complete len:96 (+) Transcript_28218:713-1000(+)
MYEYSYIKLNEDKAFTSFGVVSTSKKFVTKIVGSIPSSALIVRLAVQDSYGAKTITNSTEIELTNELTPPTIKEYVEEIAEDSTSTTDQKISAYI